MSCLSRCPHFRGVLNEGFHCNCPCFFLSRGQGELLSEEAITTIHSKLRRSKEERVAASKVLVFSHMQAL